MAVLIVDTSVVPAGNIYNTISAAIAAAAPGDTIKLTNGQVHTVVSQQVLTALPGLRFEARTPTAIATSWPVIDCPVAGLPAFTWTGVDVSFERVRIVNFTDGALSANNTNGTDIHLVEFRNGSGSCIGIGGPSTDGLFTTHPANPGLNIVDVDAVTRYAGMTVRQAAFRDITNGDGINQGGAIGFTAEDIEAVRVRGPSTANDVIATHHAHGALNNVTIRRFRARDCWGKSVLELKGNGGVVEDIIVINCSVGTILSSKAHESGVLAIDPSYNLYNVVHKTGGNARNFLRARRILIQIPPAATADPLWGGSVYGSIASQQGGAMAVSHVGVINEGNGLTPFPQAAFGVLNGHLRIYNSWMRGVGSTAQFYNASDITGVTVPTVWVEDPLAVGGHTLTTGAILLTYGHRVYHYQEVPYYGGGGPGGGALSWGFSLPAIGLVGNFSLASVKALYASLILSDFASSRDDIPLGLVNTDPVASLSPGYWRPGISAAVTGAGITGDAFTSVQDPLMDIEADYLDMDPMPTPPDLGPLTALRAESLSDDICLNDRMLGTLIFGGNAARQAVSTVPVGQVTVYVAGLMASLLFDPYGAGSPGVLAPGTCVRVDAVFLRNTTDVDAVVTMRNSDDGSKIADFGAPGTGISYPVGGNYTSSDGVIPEFVVDAPAANIELVVSYSIVACPTPSSSMLDMVLIWGQSNNVGGNLGPIDEGGLDAPDLENVLMMSAASEFGAANFDWKTKGAIQGARLPLAFQSQGLLTTAPYVDGAGQVLGGAFGLAFGKRYYAQTGRKVLLIPVALVDSHFGESEATLAAWGEAAPDVPGERTTDGLLFSEALELVNLGISLGHRFVGFVGSQGMSDIPDTGLPNIVTDVTDSRLWAVRIARQITAWRARMAGDGQGTGDHWKKPFVHQGLPNTLIPNGTPPPNYKLGPGDSVLGATYVQDAKTSLPLWIPYSVHHDMSAAAISTDDGLFVHFELADQRTAGEAMADLLTAGVARGDLVSRVEVRDGVPFDHVDAHFVRPIGPGTAPIVVIDGVRGPVMEWTASQAAYLSSARLNVTTGYTKMLWIKSTDLTSSVLMASAGVSSEHYITISGGGTTLTAGHNGVASLVQGGLLLADGAWHHIALSWDQGAAMLTAIVDGGAPVSAGEGALPPNDRIMIGGVSLTDGRTVTSASLQAGDQIDDVRVYDRALTAAEIADIYMRTLL